MGVAGAKPARSTMNYKKIYYDIINKAIRNYNSGLRWKGDGNYYELHHIIPKSLNGGNDENNLVLLTAKEHYLCHFLLFKSFDKDTIERKKMLKAWFRMSSIGICGKANISMRCYEKYKIEFSRYMSESQKGANNSQYGNSWYTSLITGVSKKFKKNPGEKWVKGRNYFNNIELYSIITKKPLRYKNGRLMEDLETVKNRKQEYGKLCARKIWDEFHSSGSKSLSEFCINKPYSIQSLMMKFKKYIPYYSKNVKKSENYTGFSSNTMLIGNYN